MNRRLHFIREQILLDIVIDRFAVKESPIGVVGNILIPFRHRNVSRFGIRKKTCLGELIMFLCDFLTRVLNQLSLMRWNLIRLHKRNHCEVVIKYHIKLW